MATPGRREHHLVMGVSGTGGPGGPGPGRRRRRLSPTLAWPLFWASIGLLAAGLAMLLAAGVADDDGPTLADIATVLAFPLYPLVGAFLASRRPQNVIGWIFLGVGLVQGFVVLSAGYGELGAAHPGTLPAPRVGDWASASFGWLTFPVPVTYLFLLFPDGRLLSPRWRWVGWAAGVGIVLTWAWIAFQPGPLEGTEDAGRVVENPFGLDGSAEVLPSLAAGIGFPLVFASMIAGFASLALRYRRGSGQQREQIKWIAYVAGLLALIVVGFNTVFGHVPDNPVASAAVALLLFVGLPASVGVAVLRHHLYDIDRIIRRSVVYGVLWAVISAVYVGVAAALGIAAGRRLPVWVAVGLTIAVTLLFQPARRRLEALADRWVFGPRKTRYELLAEFGAGLRETFDLDEVAPRLASTVRNGIDLSWARVSLFIDGAGGRRLQPVAADGIALGDDESPVARIPLDHRGERIGVIDCGPKVEGDLTVDDERLLTSLAAQAAIAVSNARLATELAARLEDIRAQAAELAASRARIVQAQDAERRRIERNIHDGAQQEITGLIAKLRLARNKVGADVAAVDKALAELQDDAHQVLVDLRELAQGIHPSVLTDRGLVAAIESRADRSPIPVLVETDPTVRRTRFSDDVEGAAYFVVSEALANVLKHSAASEAHVRMRVDDGRLRIDVEDDGVGFDPATATGGGLANLADRVAAVGGGLHVDGAPGAGTRVSLDLPALARRTARA